MTTERSRKHSQTTFLLSTVYMQVYLLSHLGYTFLFFSGSLGKKLNIFEAKLTRFFFLSEHRVTFKKSHLYVSNA